MKAQSSVYIKLQSIYKAKARQDADEVLKMVQASPGGRDVDPVEVELFCKNAAFVKLINAAGKGGDHASVDRLATVVGKCLDHIPVVSFFASEGQAEASTISTPPLLSFPSKILLKRTGQTDEIYYPFATLS